MTELEDSLFSPQVVSDSFVTSWTVDRQPPLTMGFPRQEFWSGLPFPSPGDLPNPGVKPVSTALQADFILFFIYLFFATEPVAKPLTRSYFTGNSHTELLHV